MRQLEHHWYQPHHTFLTLLLLPFSWVFRFCVAIRVVLYKLSIKKINHFAVPVIVVGNITVGGTGKTPFVIWLSEYLKNQGYSPGIVTRGVGGKKHLKPYTVTRETNPIEVGDEAVLLARRTQCPIVVCRNRSFAASTLLKQTQCNIIISDDGLQHYRLGRHIEIAMVDNTRKFGNGSMLPAGPLREHKKRLKKVDFIMNQDEQTEVKLEGSQLISLLDNQQQMDLAKFSGQTVHAIAGIGHPEKFFAMLQNYQINIIPHIFPDHYLYNRNDIDFKDHLPILMTEKDAVKCVEFADERHWFLPVTAVVKKHIGEEIMAQLKTLGDHHKRL